MPPPRHSHTHTLSPLRPSYPHQSSDIALPWQRARFLKDPHLPAVQDCRGQEGGKGEVEGGGGSPEGWGLKWGWWGGGVRGRFMVAWG